MLENARKCFFMRRYTPTGTWVLVGLFKALARKPVTLRWYFRFFQVVIYSRNNVVTVRQTKSHEWSL